MWGGSEGEVGGESVYGGDWEWGMGGGGVGEWEGGAGKGGCPLGE